MTTELFARIEQLERDRRRGRGMMRLLMVAVVAGVLGGGVGRLEPDRLFGRSLTIVDDAGTPRIELAADANGAWLHMRDLQGTLMASLGSGPIDGNLLLWRQDGTLLARLGPSQTNDGQLTLGGVGGKPQVRLGRWSDAGPQLWVKPLPPHTPRATP